MATKATTIKEAIKRWEEKSGQQAASATNVSLVFQCPPIEKMDNSLSSLVNCEKLSLSTNLIEKVTGLNSLKKLRILSLGRNYIKSFAGMECLGETLEELWISYNLVEKLKGINVLRNLRVLYMSNNLVKEWSEFNKLQELQNLEDLLFVGNPLYDACELEVWRSEAARRLPGLKKLDGETVLRDDGPPLIVTDIEMAQLDLEDTLMTKYFKSLHYSLQNIKARKMAAMLLKHWSAQRLTTNIIKYISRFENSAK